ncbi:hypothetical protein MNV49_005298 [Pseudohyphozyma bogoriensis]|nr:hypothetical protein MNV49_005298 [Pseudohyphozyma bogoriensis]
MPSSELVRPVLDRRPRMLASSRTGGRRAQSPTRQEEWIEHQQEWPSYSSLNKDGREDECCCAAVMGPPVWQKAGRTAGLFGPAPPSSEDDEEEEEDLSDTLSVPPLSPPSSTASTSSDELEDDDDVDAERFPSAVGYFSPSVRHAGKSPAALDYHDEDNLHDLLLSPPPPSAPSDASHRLPRLISRNQSRRAQATTKVIVDPSWMYGPPPPLASEQAPPPSPTLRATKSLQYDLTPAAPRQPIRHVANPAELLCLCIEASMIRRNKIVCPLRDRATIVRRGGKVREGSHLREVVCCSC